MNWGMCFDEFMFGSGFGFFIVKDIVLFYWGDVDLKEFCYGGLVVVVILFVVDD